MKKLSVKLRVTLWYTLCIILLSLIFVGLLLYIGKDRAVEMAKMEIEEFVNDNLKELEIEDGKIEEDDDIRFYQDGKYFMIFDENGKILLGGTRSEKFTQTAFKAGSAYYEKIGNDGYCFYDKKIRKSGLHLYARGVYPVYMQENAFSSVVKLFFIALPIFIVFCAGVGYFITYKAFVPIRTITKTAQRIAEGESLSERIGLGEGSDEIYTLAKSFDRMCEKLEASFEKEKQFTSDASHELRTPVSIVIAECEYALAHAKSEDELRQALQSVLKESGKMSVLISKLLLLARIDRNAVLVKEKLNFSEIAETVAEEFTAQAAKRNITVSTDIGRNIIMYSDESMLFRLLLNLMENALRYNRDNGHIFVGLREETEKIVLTVEDDGIGISEENQKRIWDRFYQVDPSRNASRNGAGLGLSFVKYIVRAHGGSIRVDSEIGKGSIFTIYFPKGET